MRVSISILILLLGLTSNAQISGTIKGLENGKEIPLVGANIFWEGTDVGAVTNGKGEFTIGKPKGASKLTASYIGYSSQTKIIISRKGITHFVLQSDGEQLIAVDVVGKVDATSVDLRRPDLTYKIDNKELRKAACCNLSESFETNATVDVSFADAVTGTKQIEMLGQSGKYALIQRENIPFARGMNASTGFAFLPGPFVESIQLTKGLSSVINGYESITGQINVELYKPETAPVFMFNGFANQGGRMEGNVVSSYKINDKTSSALLLHYSNTPFVNDANNDGFADMPTGDQMNITNRWHFSNDGKGWEGQLGACMILSNKQGGEVDYLTEENPSQNLWGYNSEGQRFEFFGKNGYVFEDDPFKSFGIIYSASYQAIDSEFGSRAYNGNQRSFYVNTIFQNIIGTSAHKYRTGVSFQYDQTQEEVNLGTFGLASANSYKRREVVPGAYFEYSFEPSERLTAVGGIRADYHSFFNALYFTPRVNVKYTVSSNTVLRWGGGRGQRTSTYIMENISTLASNRTLYFVDNVDALPEIGWNTGLSLTQKIEVGSKVIDFTVDGFYTWFENKLVKDADFDPTAYFFVNQRGSNSLSILSQLDFELFKGLEIRLAYKYLNAQDNFIEGMNQSYLIPEHRAFINLGYSTGSNWKFDLTLNWFGEKRLQSTAALPTEIRLPEYSDDFFTVNAQINKEFKNGLELFTGVDNLLNFQQTTAPILQGDNTRSPLFDSNFAWGPIFGRNIYIGLYYTIEKRD